MNIIKRMKPLLVENVKELYFCESKF